MKICIPIFFLLLGAMLTSCEKELDFEYHDIEALPVIEARLTPEGGKVALTLTTPMDEPMDLTRLTDAEMTLEDLTTGALETLSPDADGFFTSPTPGTPGHGYRLTVRRGGERYQSETRMFAPTEITDLSFSWIAMPYDDVAALQVKFREERETPGEYFWVKIYRNGKIYSWEEVDDRSATDGVCTLTMMTTRRDTDEEDEKTVIFDGDEITCTVEPISREMHDYLEALRNGSNGPALFSGSKCLGYFIATTPASATTIFHTKSDD